MSFNPQTRVVYPDVVYRGRDGELVLVSTGISFGLASGDFEENGGHTKPLFHCPWDRVKKHRLSSPAAAEPSVRLSVGMNYGEGEEEETHVFALSGRKELERLGSAIDEHLFCYKEGLKKEVESNKKPKKEASLSSVAATEATTSSHTASLPQEISVSLHDSLGSSSQSAEQGELVRLVFEHLKATNDRTNKLMEALVNRDSMSISDVSSPSFSEISVASIREPPGLAIPLSRSNSNEPPAPAPGLSRRDSYDSQAAHNLARQLDKEDKLAKETKRRPSTGEQMQVGSDTTQQRQESHEQLKQRLLNHLKQNRAGADAVPRPGAYPEASSNHLDNIPESEELLAAADDDSDNSRNRKPPHQLPSTLIDVDEFSDRHLVRAYLVAQQSHATIDSVAPKPPGGGESSSDKSSNEAPEQIEHPEFWELSEVEFLDALEKIMLSKCVEGVPLDQDNAGSQRNVQEVRASVTRSIDRFGTPAAVVTPVLSPVVQAQPLRQATPNQQAECCVIL